MLRALNRAHCACVFIYGFLRRYQGDGRCSQQPYSGRGLLTRVKCSFSFPTSHRGGAHFDFNNENIWQKKKHLRKKNYNIIAGLAHEYSFRSEVKIFSGNVDTNMYGKQ